LAAKVGDMDRSPPRHLSPRPAPGLRLNGAVEIALAIVAVGLVAAIVGLRLDSGGVSVSARRATPDPTVAGAPPASAASPTEATASTRPGSVSLLPDPSFERGVAGWSPAAGTRLDRVGSARDGRWAANFGATSMADPSIVAAKVATVRAQTMYLASLWLRSSRPGAAVRVDLVEVRDGRRFAVDTVGAVLDGVAWRRLEIAHDGHVTGTVLALELSAPDLPAAASVSVDLVEVRATRPPMSTGSD
jgi:hypothetical protein